MGNNTVPNTTEGRERIAKLEAHKENTDRQFSAVMDTLESMDSKMQAIENSVTRIQLKVEKSVSFVGGIAFTFSILGGAMTFAAVYILRKIGIEV
jgi:predicted  nucleic acid-binding Zn-ribbon protein